MRGSDAARASTEHRVDEPQPRSPPVCLQREMIAFHFANSTKPLQFRAQARRCPANGPDSRTRDVTKGLKDRNRQRPHLPTWLDPRSVKLPCSLVRHRRKEATFVLRRGHLPAQLSNARTKANTGPRAEIGLGAGPSQHWKSLRTSNLRRRGPAADRVRVFSRQFTAITPSTKAVRKR